MNYMTALRQATAQIQAAGVDDEAEAQAGLRLACLAFRSPTASDQAWALLGLELLSVLAELYPDPAPVAIIAAQPSTVGPPVRAAVFDLVRVLAEGYERASAQPQLASGRRFAYAGAASRLHSAARGLA
ncbi:hypothetical protein WEI85_07720 [Actinomycetes bacterium KLBMP 9797]